MQSINKIIIFLFLLFSIVSCQKEFTLTPEETKKRIVVNSFLKNTNSIDVTVTESFAVTGEAEVQELKDAQVVIFENGVYKEDLIFTKNANDIIGKFSTSFIPTINDDYKIEVSHPDFDDVSSIAQVPEGVDIADASVEFVGGNAFNFSFNLNDPSEVNYYYLKMFFRGYIIDSLTQEREYVAQERIAIPVTSVPDGQQYLDNGYIFNDETFGGQGVTVAGVAKYSRIFYQTPGGSGIPVGGPPPEVMTDSSTLFIRLETLSEEAYKYYTSHATFLNNEIVDVFGEASSIYSNVENGLGIFAGVYVSEIGVEVKE